MNQLCKLGSPIVTVTPTTDAVVGKAAMLRSQVLGIVKADSTPGFGGTLVPGLVNSGVLNTSNLTNPLRQGQPYTGKPQCLQGYYKYLPYSSDSAALYASLKSGGVEVGRASMVVKSAVPQYTMFNIPFVYTSPNTPDSINIVFVSSAGSQNNKGYKGSRLFIDEIGVYMVCPTAIEKPEITFSHVSPNPAKDKVEISLNNEIVAANMLIFNMEGKLVASHDLTEIRNEVSIAELPAGIYVYHITATNGKHNVGKLIKQD